MEAPAPLRAGIHACHLSGEGIDKLGQVEVVGFGQERRIMEQKQLRIAMLSVHSSPTGELGTTDTGGMSVYIRELAKQLGRRGHLIDIFTRCHPQKHQRKVRLY
jgi:hypothetical protein